jgi:hypothetical protein
MQNPWEIPQENLPSSPYDDKISFSGKIVDYGLKTMEKPLFLKQKDIPERRLFFVKLFHLRGQNTVIGKGLFYSFLVNIFIPELFRCPLGDLGSQTTELSGNRNIQYPYGAFILPPSGSLLSYANPEG